MNQPNTHTAVNPILETAFENREVRIFGTVENPVVARSDIEPILKIQNIAELRDRHESATSNPKQTS